MLPSQIQNDVMLRQIGCLFETVLSSATVLALADLVGLGIEVPQVLVPEHPAVVDGVAVGPVVVAIGGVSASIVLGPVFSLKLQRE